MTHTPRVWRKSSYSSPDGQCVEVADTPEGIAMRDSKDPAGPILSFPRSDWADFVSGVKRGDFG